MKNAMKNTISVNAGTQLAKFNLHCIILHEYIIAVVQQQVRQCNNQKRATNSSMHIPVNKIPLWVLICMDFYKNHLRIS
jgi:hypothetical protein